MAKSGQASSSWSLGQTFGERGAAIVHDEVLGGVEGVFVVDERGEGDFEEAIGLLVAV